MQYLDSQLKAVISLDVFKNPFSFGVILYNTLPNNSFEYSLPSNYFAILPDGAWIVAGLYDDV